MAPQERRNEPSTIQQFPKGSSKTSETKKEKKQKKKEEKAAKKAALKRQKEKDAKVKKKEEAKAAKQPGLFARLFKKAEVIEGTPTDPDWIPAKETEGPKKGESWLKDLWKTKENFSEKSGSGGSESKESGKEGEKKEEAAANPAEETSKEEEKEEEKKDEGKAPYEEVLAEKDKSAMSALEKDGSFCLGIVEKSDDLPAPDDAPWEFSRPWHVAFLLAHRLDEDGQLPTDALTGGWVFHDPPDGCVMRIGKDKDNLLAPERAFTAEGRLRWQPGLEKLHVVAKAGDKEFKAQVKLPRKLKDVKLSGIVILVDGESYSRKEG